MRTVDAQKRLYADTKAILEGAGLKNGLGADRDGILFYPARKKSSALPEEDTFVTYECYYVTEAGSADGEPHSQIVSASIDIFTKDDRTSSGVTSIVSAIEDSAFAKGYRMEVKSTDSYDESNEIEHLSYDIKKRLR